MPVYPTFVSFESCEDQFQLNIQVQEALIDKSCKEIAEITGVKI
jgi:hypothetical protein